MPPGSENPIIIAAQIIGVLIALPIAAVAIKGIFVLGSMWRRFDDLVKAVSKIQERLEEKDGESNANAWSFAIVEEDINELQAKAGLEVRDYPDRRVGPSDRRKRS